MKNGGHVRRPGYRDRATKSTHGLHFLRFLSEDWGKCQTGICLEGPWNVQDSIEKGILRNLYLDMVNRT